MIYSYIFHESVNADYDEAYEWYEEQQEGLGERFYQLSGVKWIR
jgi:hypothetical protein